MDWTDMIVVEEQCHQHADWQSNEHPLHRQMPEINEPDIWPVNSRKESLCDWQVPNLRSFEVTWKMCKAYPEEGCNLVILSIGYLPQQLQYWVDSNRTDLQDKHSPRGIHGFGA